MSKLTQSVRNRTHLIVFTVGVIVLGALYTGTMATAAPSLPAGATRTAQSTTAKIGAGAVAHAKTYVTQPAITAAQQAKVNAAMATANRPGPSFKKYAGAISQDGGAPVEAPSSANALPADFVVMRNKKLPAGGAFSGVSEPSTAGTGKNIFQTGNWFATYSHNNGGIWTYLNPFTIFGSGFCCDQVTVFDSTHQRVFWLMQFGDHIVLANSSVTDLAGWCFYNIGPANYSLPAGDSFDYNHMGISTNNVFWSTDIYNSGGGFVESMVSRFPIDPMVNCAGFGFGFIPDSNTFAPSFVQGVGDVMYWGSDWTNLGLGNGFRVYRWEDASGALAVYDRAIDAFTFMFQGGGNCASADAVVTNWCWFADSRMQGGGYLGIPSASEPNTTDTVIGFAVTAGQGGFAPFPFTRRIYFRASDMTYLGSNNLYSTGFAIIYPDQVANAHGAIGMVTTWGGGTGTTHYFPGTLLTIDDDFSSAQPWANNFITFGAGNSCGGGTGRWGDYQTIRAWNPNQLVFNAVSFSLTANASVGCGNTQPVAERNYVFGRGRDVASFNAYKAK